jgi:hypothetical protein
MYKSRKAYLKHTCSQDKFLQAYGQHLDPVQRYINTKLRLYDYTNIVEHGVNSQLSNAMWAL